MKKTHRILGLIVIGLMVCLMAGCGKGSKENEQGLAFYAVGEYESAAAAFGEAMAADNTNSEYYRNRALALIELGKYDQAQTCLDYAEELEEKDTLEGKRARGILYYEQEIYERALLCFEDALALSEGTVGKIEYDILYYLAECQMCIGQYDDAAATYTRLVDAGNTAVNNYYLRGVAYLKNGNASDAGLDFNRVVESGSYAEYWKIYSVLKEHGEIELAKTYLSKAVLLGGNLDSDHRWRAEFHYFLGNYEEALAEFDQVSVDALDVDAYMMIAHIHQAMGDVTRVKAAFSVAEQKAPNDPYLIYQQTLFWMENKEYGEAYTRIQKGQALENNEYRQQMDYCKAVCLEYMGEYADALTAFQAYKEKYGATDEINHEIAFLMTRLGHAE
ncbi:MAG: tetratricopeptide repeat protein [Lachnospiraceae bacterium]|nr:tetratricopeptide repeat protein [Lachnospiraceae bacterium]